jgi:hypothetical protein
MDRYFVLQTFNAKELSGPHIRVMSTGEELILLRWMGEENKRSAIFVVPHASVTVLHGPAYEAAREVFESSTELIH